MTTYDFSVFPSLQWVACNNNRLTSVNIAGLVHIDEIEFSNNLLTLLNVNGLSTLRLLSFAGNQINNIDLNTLTTLNDLSCAGNPISVINVNGHTNLGALNVSNTLVNTVDCSQTGVTQLFASNCFNLQTINVRNGAFSFSDPDLLYYAFRIENNPNLVSICTNNGEQNNLALTNYNTSGSVVVYNGANCDIPVQVNMGINDFDTTGLKLYPNPTSDIVNIDVSDNAMVKRAIINNVLGQTIMTFENTKMLDIDSLTKGTYFVTVETDSGTATQRIIKQ